MIPLALQAPDASPGGRGSVAVLVFAAALVFIYVLARRRRALAAGVTFEEAKQRLATLEQEGKRDLRTEAHLAALFSWTTAYAVLMCLSFAATGFLEAKSPEEEERRAPDRVSYRIFAGLLAAEAFALRSSGRGMGRGRERVRWGASALLTLLSLTAVGAGLLQAGTSRISALPLHAAAAAYALAGATFLLLPRCARICAPEYREIVRETKGSATDAALNLARATSAFSWAPIVVLALTMLLGELLKR
jgi:hypothetical protein